MINPAAKAKMHPRNRFRDGYDFSKLVKASPAFARFVGPNRFGDVSIDFGKPEAVKALNQALLAEAYGIRRWDIPEGYLCPPIPGRSDYLHFIADLLAEGNGDVIPRGPDVRILDVGMGANCIYPLIGAAEYGWRFVGTEIDREALDWAKKTVASNPSAASLIECRLQTSRREYFRNVIQPDDSFAAVICNPPFHGSAAEAAEENLRKRRNLHGARPKDSAKSAANFGGQSGELWCPGGELGFIQRMIAESVAFADRVRWFTTLVSKGAHVSRLVEVVQATNPADVRIIEMGQGQKQSRILAWTFRA